MSRCLPWPPDQYRPHPAGERDHPPLLHHASGHDRADLPVFEADDAGRIKINPLAGWSRAQIEAVFAARNLPRHPLVSEGYLSIGCMTCTDRVRSGEDLRAGRWRGRGKTECGIHQSLKPHPGQNGDPTSV